MEIKNFFESKLRELIGSTIAIIYTFEKEDAAGFKHYDYWGSEVISSWLSAVDELGCIPYILDVKTFMLKAAMGTLPHIDYCVNLNAGNIDLNNLCLVPAISSFLGIPCIPCNAKNCAVGEDKYFANLIATNGKIRIPDKHSPNTKGGIIRDRSYGSSIGIRRTNYDTHCSESEICQEFIVGTDVTIPILYNPISKKLEALPPIAYRHNKGSEWFLSETEKLNHSYEKIPCILSKETEAAILQLAELFDIRTYCRFDTRVKNFDFREIALSDIYFLEINPTPTIHNKINFALALELAEDKHPLKSDYIAYKSLKPNATITGFILLCSVLGLTAKR